LLSKENVDEEILRRLSSEEKTFKSISPTPTPAPSPSDEEFVSGDVIPPKARNIKQLLSYTTVENLLANRGNIISLKDSDTVERALQTFREHEIQSVAVYKGDKFEGIVETKDILAFFCGMDCEQHGMRETFLHQTLLDLIERPSRLVSIGTPLSEVLRILSQGEAHRVHILDEQTHSLFNVISQLFLVQFVAKNISLLSPDQRNKPVSEFMKKMCSVNTIPSDTSTYKSFTFLYDDNISAAAVVDRETGRIIDTISTSDLAGLLYDGFDCIEASVVEFLAATRRTKALKPPITCLMEDTLEYVVLKLASTRVHRLWVVGSSANQYLGLVNLTNVLEEIQSFF